MCIQNVTKPRYHDEEHANLLNSMWLTAITFLCVGYGDIVPNTYCGRGITLICGMVVSVKFYLPHTHTHKSKTNRRLSAHSRNIRHAGMIR